MREAIVVSEKEKTAPLEQRFIKLNGDRAYEPLWKTFHKNGDFDVCLYSTAFMMAAQPEAVIMMASSIASAQFYLHNNVLERAIFREVEKDVFKKNNQSSLDLCIDKCPDANTPPTSAENMASAIKAHKKLRIAATFESAFVLTGITAAPKQGLREALPNATTGEVLWSLGLFTALIGSYAHRRISSIKRFKKVKDGEWVIRELPPPEKEAQKDKAGEIVPQFAPYSS